MVFFSTTQVVAAKAAERMFLVMEYEAEVVPLYLYDQRIGKLIREHVHGSTFAEYLTDALLESHGSLMVTRLLIGALTPYLPKAGVMVGRNDVIRLGVHNCDEDVIERLSLALKEIEPNYITLSRDLEYSLTYDPSRVSSDTDQQAHFLPRRIAVSDDQEDHKAYIRIFLCAFAMCKRLELDPRQPKQAVAVSSRG